MQYHEFRTRTLNRYMEYRDRPPTFWKIIKLSWPLFFLCSVIIFILLILPKDESSLPFTTFAVGTFVGVMFAQVLAAISTIKFSWPFLEEFINWEQIEEKSSAIQDGSEDDSQYEP